MYAIKLNHPARLENLIWQAEREAIVPGVGEIKVRIHASSLNFHDLAVVSGMIPTQDGRIPLSDGAGVVEAVGDGVQEFSVGDHVVSCFFPYWENGRANICDFSTTPGDGVDGFARSHVTRPAHWFTHAPKGYSHAEAATLTTAGLTAWRALVVNGNLKAGETVLVLGTGGVSIFALQIAKAMGARVIATTSSNEKFERLLMLGADHVINYKTGEAWGQAVLDLTGGRGVDHVIEVGGAGTLPHSINACCIGGHIAVIGILAGLAGPIPIAAVMAKQQRLQGLIVGSRQDQKEMIRTIERTGLKPLIDRTFDLQDIVAAFQYQASGAHFGKICLKI